VSNQPVDSASPADASATATEPKVDIRMDRRALLQSAAGAVGAVMLSAGGLSPRRARAQALTPYVSAAGQIPDFVQALTQPPTQTLPLLGTTTLTVQNGINRFHPNVPTTTNILTYGTGYLGPTLVAQTGTTRTVKVTHNTTAYWHPFHDSMDAKAMGTVALDQTNPRVSTHLHGGVSRPDSDGHPEDVINKGQTKTHQWSFGKEPKLIWYHDHALGITRLNAQAGLAGACIVRSVADSGDILNTIGLPSGSYEIPLIFQDKVLTYGNGDQLYPPGEWSPEFFGDLATVNGKVTPFQNVDAGVYRFRMVNACNARVLEFTLAAEAAGVTLPKMYVIGTDQGLLNNPAPVSKLRLAPGERLDVLVDFRSLKVGQAVRLRNSAGVPYPSTAPDITWLGTSTTLTDWLRFVATGKAGFQNVPTTLRDGLLKPAKLPAVVTTGTNRTVTLTEMETDMGLMVMLNNLEWATTSVDQMKQGTTEIWSIINTTQDAHPIHLHLARFRIVDRRSINIATYMEANPMPAMGTRWNPAPAPSMLGTVSLPTPDEAGWKDTVLVMPGEMLRISVEVPTAATLGFDPDATFTAASGKVLRGYAYHCHILEHEDHDMMLPLRFVTTAATNL